MVDLGMYGELTLCFILWSSIINWMWEFWKYIKIKIISF